VHPSLWMLPLVLAVSTVIAKITAWKVAELRKVPVVALAMPTLIFSMLGLLMWVVLSRWGIPTHVGERSRLGFVLFGWALVIAGFGYEDA